MIQLIFYMFKMTYNKKLKIIFLEKVLDNKFRELLYNVVPIVNDTVLCTLKI